LVYGSFRQIGWSADFALSHRGRFASFKSDTAIGLFWGCRDFFSRQSSKVKGKGDGMVSLKAE